MNSNPSFRPAIAATALATFLTGCGDYEAGVASSRTEVVMDREAAKPEGQKIGEEYRRMLQRLKIGEATCPEIAGLYAVSSDSEISQAELRNALMVIEETMEQPASQRIRAYERMGREPGATDPLALSRALECHELLEIIALSEERRKEAEALLGSGKHTPLQVLAIVEKSDE